jgi:hypothetical protein
VLDLAPTHAFLPTVTSKLPQSGPIRDGTAGMSAGKPPALAELDGDAREPDKKPKYLVFQILMESQTIGPQAPDGLFCNDPGVSAGIVLKIQTPGSVRLPA